MIRKLLILTLINFSSILLSAQCTFKNIGHRGGSSYYYPENTLLSMEQAYIEGAWACEVDVLFTKDSVLILLHDDYLDRTSNGYGNVIDKTFAEIELLDAGSWKNPRFAGEKIPSLIQAIQLAYQYNRKLYLNMKVYEPEMVANALAQSGVPPDVIIIDPDELYKVIEYHSLMPNTPLVYFVAPPDPITDTMFYQTLLSNNVIAAELYAGDILDTSNSWTIQYKNILHSYGIDLWAYTVNDNGYLHTLKNFGIDGLETDRPTEAKNVFCYNESGGFFPEKRITGQWDFTSQNFDATNGAHLVERGDTTTPGQHALFGTTSEFGIPDINGVETDVMKTPAYDSFHNLVFFSNIAPQGNPGGLFCDNDYTIIVDLLKPASSEEYISLFQTSNNNSDDGDLFLRTSDSSIGIAGMYFGPIYDSTWYRIAAVFDLPNQVLQLYLNGALFGNISLINSLDGRFCLNNNWGIQPSCLFSDDNGETSPLFVSSIQLRDYAMTSEEIAAMGEPTSQKIPTEILFEGSICPIHPNTIPDISICEGTNIFLDASAGDTVNYRWQVNSGNGWNEISGTHYSQSANDTLQILDADTSMNNWQYRCIISTDCYVSTTEILLNIIPIPHINLELTGNTELCSGDTSVLFAIFDSSAQITWYHDNQLFSTDSLTQLITLAGSYQAIATNNCGADTSSEIIFSEHETAVITTQPSDQNIAENSNALFFVSATGEGLQFQWQADTGAGWFNLSNDAHFINTTTSSLGILQASLNMDGYLFRCLVNGLCNNLYSETALLNVNISDIKEGNSLSFSIFPNPNNGNFTINFTEFSHDNPVTIYSFDGKIIPMITTTESNSQFIQIRVSPGIYLLEYKSEKGILRKAITVL